MHRITFRLLVVVVSAWTVLTWQRALIWRSELSLWTDATTVSPLKPRGWINLGLAREVAGDLPGGFAAQQTALALSFQPRLSRYQQVFSQVASATNMARMLAQADREGEAKQMLDDIILRYPNFAHARYNRAVLLARIGRCDEGQADAAIARRLEPSLEPIVCPPTAF